MCRVLERITAKATPRKHLKQFIQLCHFLNCENKFRKLKKNISYQKEGVTKNYEEVGFRKQIQLKSKGIKGAKQIPRFKVN